LEEQNKKQKTLTENEANNKPRRIVDTRRRGDLTGTIKKNGDVDVFERRLRIFPLPEPERNGKEDTNKQRP